MAISVSYLYQLMFTFSFKQFYVNNKKNELKDNKLKNIAVYTGLEYIMVVVGRLAVLVPRLTPTPQWLFSNWRAFLTGKNSN